MNEETLDKVEALFREVIANLGPPAEKTYQIVYARIVAESIIWLIVGIALLVFGLSVATFFWRARENAPEQSYSVMSKSDLTWASVIVLVFTLIIASAPIVVNSINLLSPDYVTIARILELAGAR